MSEPVPILEITQEFFTSPMWQDTIKDFVLANCNIFTGEEEFALEHLNCHKQFCKVIEDTLNIYLLDIIGINFDIFQKACLEACHHPNSIASNVIHILKQATDFRYFAAKMYAYNVMLDREAAVSFLVEGDDENAFFVTQAVKEEEVQIQEQAAQVAKSELNQVEAELGLPPTNPEELFTSKEPEIVQSEPQLEPQPEPEPEPENPPEPEKPLPPKKQPPPLLDPMEPLPKKEEEAPQNTLSQTIPTITEAQRNEMRRKILKEREAMNRTLDPEEIAKRKAAFEQRKQQIVSQKREECKEQIDIDLNLKKHEKPTIAPEEDPMDAIRRALAGRVKNMIDEDH